MKDIDSQKLAGDLVWLCNYIDLVAGQIDFEQACQIVRISHHSQAGIKAWGLLPQLVTKFQDCLRYLELIGGTCIASSEQKATIFDLMAKTAQTEPELAQACLIIPQDDPHFEPIAKKLDEIHLSQAKEVASAEEASETIKKVRENCEAHSLLMNIWHAGAYAKASAAATINEAAEAYDFSPVRTEASLLAQSKWNKFANQIMNSNPTLEQIVALPVPKDEANLLNRRRRYLLAEKIDETLVGADFDQAHRLFNCYESYLELKEKALLRMSTVAATAFEIGLTKNVADDFISLFRVEARAVLREMIENTLKAKVKEITANATTRREISPVENIFYNDPILKAIIKDKLELLAQDKLKEAKSRDDIFAVIREAPCGDTTMLEAVKRLIELGPPKFSLF